MNRVEDYIDSFSDQISDYKDIKRIVEDYSSVPTDIILCSKCNIPGITHGFDIYECERCGEILETAIDIQAEWRNFGADGKADPARCSLPVNNLLPKSSMSSTILSAGSSNYGMRRTQKIHSWGCMTYKERCLHNIFQDISLRSLNGCILNNISKTAHEFYKIVSELHVSRGEIRKGLIAASLYMACKKLRVPRTTQEIADIFQVTERCVTRGNKKFTELWALAGKPPIQYFDNCQSSDYIIRFCSKLDRGNDEFFQLSKKISDECNNKQLLKQNTPVSVAAASIFTAVNILKLPISRGDVSKIANTSEVTISKCVKELQAYNKEFIVYIKKGVPS